MWGAVAMLAAGCAGRTPTGDASGIEVIYVAQPAPAPRLCLSPVTDAGRLRGDAPQAWVDAAQLIAAGDLVSAQVRLSEAPEHPGADALRGAVQLLSGDVDAARITYRTLVTDWPEDFCLQITAAAVYMADREPIMARTHATDAWRLQPDNPDALYVYALAWLEAGDEGRATAALRKMVATRPDHPGAGLLLGSDYLKRGHAELAAPLLEAARAGGIDVTRPLSEAYFRTNRMDDYVALASAAGWPIGDGGAIARSDDPGAAWRALLGVEDGETLQVTLETSMGVIRCALFWEEAPLAVGNFVGLARGGQPWTDPVTQSLTTAPMYPGTVFHRVIPGFMIQGGDPLGTGAGGPGYRFHDELTPGRKFDAPGMLAMANAGPDSNGSQFFITDAPVPHLNGAHTIFGQCDAPSVVVTRKITRAPADRDNKPFDDVTINQITFSSAP
ncbi:MAG: cyclophilin family peptidyl-prolyl cis-trans isomerase [Myxococcota bacterium]|jgi:cyclophilin family peptidyl-prolyl cis-trans isomerase